MRKKKKNLKQEEKQSTYQYTKEEAELLNTRKKRFEVMIAKKKKLGINEKCDRMDELFPPHLVDIENPDISEATFSNIFDEDKLFTDNARKSKPLAFEKITTAVALMIKEHPKVITKAFDEKSRELNLLVENVYYENYSTMRKIRVLRKYVYHLCKYGIGYIREYIKKTYKKVHDYDENGKLITRLEYDVFDQVAENIHPKNVILDDNCLGVKDVNRPANDCWIIKFLTKEEFDLEYPEEKYPKAKYVAEDQSWIGDPGFNEKETTVDSGSSEKGRKKILLAIYENRGEGLREVWANQVPLESVPLPGGELSISGEKWVENDENYDGIGIGQIIEIYQPIVDDILNASLERLRQIVRPIEDHFNNLENADEADDVAFGAGAVRKWTGNPNDLVYTSPPPRSAQEQQEMQDLDEEIDRATMVPRNLAGTDDAKTAYQSAQNREAALNRLSIPLDAIKYTLEDCANLSIRLFKLVYQEPLQTDILTPADDEFDEALAILEKEPDSERVVIMEKDEEGNPTQIGRRRFRKMELPLTKEPDEEGKPTGRIVESEEKVFWELTPKTFNWNGRLEIIAESFLPVSKVLEDEQKKETIDFLLNIPTVDEMGNPVLKDANGQPYTIDRVRLIKERLKLHRHFDPDKVVVPLEKQQQVAGSPSNPLANPEKITLNEALGNTRPELKTPTSLKK